MLVMNFRPVTDQDTVAWEGLWTLPSEGYMINQLVSGYFDGRERSFAFVTGHDGNVRLAEFSRTLNADILPDKTEKPISWQFITRADTMGDETSEKIISDAVMTLRGIVGEVSVKAYVRTDQSEWIPYAEACFTGSDECVYGSAPSREALFKMGGPPYALSRMRWVQFLVKITGAASVESIRIKSTIEKGGESDGNIPSSCVNVGPTEGNVFEFDPFEYSI